jgi:hypothetical protein
MVAGLIKFAVLWVRYDRRVAGRAPSYDVYDHRAGMKQQQLSGQGEASPADRGDPCNGWIDWAVRARADDPTELAAALEAAGLSIENWTA